jgi:hypothetical protein
MSYKKTTNQHQWENIIKLTKTDLPNLIHEMNTQKNKN